MEAVEIAKEQTKEELLKRMLHYVNAEAIKQRRPEWAIVSDIFQNGSGVSQALWSIYIKGEGE